MSNYTFLIVSNSARSRLNKWLGEHSSPTEYFLKRLAWNRTLYIFSKAVESSVHQRTYVRGTILNADLDTLAFGIDGWESAPSHIRQNPGSHDGEYCVASWSRSGLNIARDLIGNARLLTTAGAQFAAASDSLLVLASLRRLFGERVSNNEEVLLARSMLNNLAAQQLSPDTVFREIDFVPSGDGVSISKDFEITRTGPHMADRLLSNTVVDARDAIRASATAVARTILGLASVANWNSVLSLSGGYDSRVVFCAARATGAHEKFSYASLNRSPVHARDFEVATQLASAFSMRRDLDGSEGDDAHVDDRMTLWAATLAGVYDGFGPPRTSRTKERTFAVTGNGAELLKGNWGWRSFDALVNEFEPSIARDAFAQQVRSGVEQLNGQSSYKYVSELFYIGYRNGLHSAAGHIGVHMTGVHPLQQFSLARLGHARTNEGHCGSPSTIADLSILLDPEAATFTYDDPGRNIAPNFAEQRLQELGGRIRVDQLEPLTVYGDPDRVPDGPTRLSMELARALGAFGDFNADHILTIARTGVAQLPDSLREIYAPMVANAEWKISKSGGYVRTAGASTARVASLITQQLVSD
ncbi:hypothetical protein [Humidisolicoccus flavus]|uniref:hypothetical protein n=1 Tax=Humidisolicoccus flavus TaxID=3111414 RepID=UPI00324CBFD9